MYVYKNTINKGAKPKSLLKVCPEDARYWAFTVGNIPMQVKEGKGCLLEGGVFFRSLQYM